MNIDFEVMATIISGISVIVLAYQVRSGIVLNRYNQTFKAIADLNDMLNKEENADIIQKINLLDDFSERLSLVEAIEIYKDSNNQKKIYEILNFYESLALSVFCKHIDGKILRKMAGSRIYNAYVKLSPFISAITDNYEEPQIKPYQHFNNLYLKWNKYYGGNKYNGGNNENR